MFLSPRLAIVGNDTTNHSVIPTNLIPPTEQGVRILVANAVLAVLTAVWTALRFWCRRMKGAGYFLEDWMHLGALVCFYGAVASNVLMVLVGGSGHHMSELQPWHIIRLSMAAYSTQVLYAFSMGLVKMSITWMLKRIFVTQQFALAARAVMVFTAAWTVMTILVGIFICRPVEMNWNPYTPGGICGDQLAAFASVGIVDIVNEVSILALPIPMIWRLQMPLRYKGALFCVFGAGILTSVFAAARLYNVIHLDFTDVSYSAVDANVYATVEPGVAIIVSCSPILRPLFDKVFGHKASSSSNFEEE
ncbi:uncharacterized protein PG986_011257 [Apiospora aurea]|uniref:Rhodopsin domain-containing protein n=1 Tax=Apiospora aurea TaxID=335848 RepID=A0ABR1Q4K7_9PEZI